MTAFRDKRTFYFDLYLSRLRMHRLERLDFRQRLSLKHKEKQYISMPYNYTLRKKMRAVNDAFLNAGGISVSTGTVVSAGLTVPALKSAKSIACQVKTTKEFCNQIGLGL